VGSNFGISVSSAGDVNGDGYDDIIIGAYSYNSNTGRSYLYFGGLNFNTVADLTMTGEATFNVFGGSVSSAGDVNGDGYSDVIIGAYGYNSFTGRAYIYYGGASMNSVADVTMTGQFTNNEFGKSVSGAGDLNYDGFDDVIVGAYAANAYTGKAYIFYGSGAMDNTADLTMNGEFGNDQFGVSVSDAGDVNYDGYSDVIVGASVYNSGFGKAYIYFGGIAMNNIADVTMIGEGIVNYFGSSVSNAGDVNDDGYSDVIVGANGYNSYTGRTYIYFGGASMNSIADVTMTGEAANNTFGFSVSESGDINGDGFADVIVGGYGFSASKGRAYVYYGGTTMNNVVDLYMTGDTTGNYFGYTVSGGGDVNGDGFADMIVGAFGHNSSTGRAYVYTNTMTGEDIPDITLFGQIGYFGSVSSAGDVNGDGFSDVIVGAEGYLDTIAQAYIFYGGILMDNIPDVIMSDGQAVSRFGYSVSTAGDVNGDGYSDVIVGSHGTYNDTGKAYIYFGGIAMNNVPDLLLRGNKTQDNFGFSVSHAGDVNSDGYADVIVGEREYPSSRGRALIYFGGVTMNNVADVIMTGEMDGNIFGNVSAAGDVNNDGYDDVIVGAEYYNSLRGRVYVYYGGVSMNNVADVIMTGQYPYDRFGGSLSGAGDINGDGYSDIIVGANDNLGDSAKAYIYYGGSAMDNIPEHILPDDNGSYYFGVRVSGAGDVNNDGNSDVLISDAGINNIFFGGKYMDKTKDVAVKSGLMSSAGDLNGDNISDVIVGQAQLNNGRAFIYLSSPPDNRKNLFLFGAIQGMYDPVTDIEIPDTIKVYLRNATSPFARVDSSKNILLGPGTGQYFLFRNAINNTPYYVDVTHRNALTTWSATPVTFTNSDASIAFSVSSIYAYGNNEIQVDNSPYDVYAFYSGDVNQDGIIDAGDISSVENDALNSVFGYVPTDLTGDDAVDASDVSMVENNSVLGVYVITP